MATSYNLLPAANRQTLSTPEEQALVRQAIANVLPQLPEAKEIIVKIHDPVPSGMSLAGAHAYWKEPHFTKIETPFNLPRQPPGATCPDRILRVTIDCINKRIPGMGSWYGFQGYALSILLTLDGNIWDARGEVAQQ